MLILIASQKVSFPILSINNINELKAQKVLFSEFLRDSQTYYRDHYHNNE